MDKYPSHRSLESGLTGKITTVMDCFTGKILRVFRRRYEVGAVVESGAIKDPKTGMPDVEKKFWVITGYSSWQSAKAMTRRCGTDTAQVPLEPGVWHEVISE